MELLIFCDTIDTSGSVMDEEDVIDFSKKPGKYTVDVEIFVGI